MTTPATPAAPPARGLGLVLTALGLGAIASILDSTIVNVAIDHLASVFNANLTDTQWVITGFLLAMAAIVPVAGWLLDRFGGRRTWMLSLAVFLIGSVLCGIAWNLPALIAFRILQGLGAGLILPVLMAVLTKEAGKHRLMTAMGVFALIIQVGPILGPVVGGLLIDAANWRWIFLVNIPFCLAGLILAPLALQDDRPAPHQRRPFDMIGLLLSVPAVTAFVYGTANLGPDHGITHTDVWVPITIGVALIIAFVAWSHSRPARALIDVHLFRRRSFAITSITSILLGFTTFGGMLLIPLYFQTLHGSTPLQAGLLLVPQGIGTALVVIAGKKPLARVSARTRLILGFVIMAAGTVPFAVPDLRDATWLLVITLVIRGIGVGLCAPTLNVVAMLDLAPDELGRGSAAFNIVQRIGAPLGTTVLAVVLASALQHGSDTSAAIAAAFASTFWWSILLTALPAVLSLLLPTTPARSNH